MIVRACSRLRERERCIIGDRSAARSAHVSWGTAGSLDMPTRIRESPWVEQRFILSRSALRSRRRRLPRGSMRPSSRRGDVCQRRVRRRSGRRAGAVGLRAGRRRAARRLGRRRRAHRARRGRSVPGSRDPGHRDRQRRGESLGCARRTAGSGRSRSTSARSRGARCCTSCWRARTSSSPMCGRARSARLGLDADTLRERYPRLVYARGHGYGVRGPDADQAGYDASAFWSRGGLAHVLTPPGSRLPDQPARRDG